MCITDFARVDGANKLDNKWMLWALHDDGVVETCMKGALFLHSRLHTNIGTGNGYVITRTLMEKP